MTTLITRSKFLIRVRRTRTPSDRDRRVEFSISYYSTASLKIESGGEGAVIIGGYCFTACIGEYCMGEEISKIAMYSDYDPYYGDAGWKVVGNLKQARFEHAAISNGQMILTVGGRDL